MLTTIDIPEKRLKRADFEEHTRIIQVKSYKA